MERTLVMGAAVAFVGFVAYLTISMLSESPSVGRAVIGFIVLAILAFGVYGALGSPSDE